MTGAAQRQEGEPRSAFLFVWRESSFTDAVQTVLRPRCRLLGHAWERTTWWESWDVGAGYEEEWWECRRCEAFTESVPEEAPR